MPKQFRKAWYAMCATLLAEIIGCPIVLHYGGSEQGIENICSQGYREQELREDLQTSIIELEKREAITRGKEIEADYKRMVDGWERGETKVQQNKRLKEEKEDREKALKKMDANELLRLKRTLYERKLEFGDKLPDEERELEGRVDNLIKEKIMEGMSISRYDFPSDVYCQA
jgi:hypothetical protein